MTIDPWPERCEDVNWRMLADREMRDEEMQVGDLVWDPKDVSGHVLNNSRLHQISIEEPWAVPTCECGKVDVLDHHVFLLAKKPPP